MLTFCFVPVEKVKETYWLPPQQICSFLLQLGCLSDTHFALVDSLANNFFLTSSFFFVFLTLPHWTWIFIKSMPDSSVCLFRVRIFMLSPKAIVQFSGQTSDTMSSFSLSHIVFWVFASLPPYTSIITSSLNIFYYLFSLYLWKDNLIFLTLTGVSVFLFTLNIFSSVRHSFHLPLLSFVLRTHLSMLSLILFSSASSFAQTLKSFLLHLSVCSWLSVMALLQADLHALSYLKS